MINLLPPKEKEGLKLEKNKKLIIVLGNVVLISLVCLVLILFSLKFYILKKNISEKSAFNSTQNEYQNPNFLSLKEDIQKYNSLLTKVDNFYKKEIYFSDVLKIILSINRPKGLYFTNIALGNNEEINKVKISISGTSDVRENLLIFRDNINSNSLLKTRYKIENIYFPPDSWVKPKDINFNLTFDVSQSK